MTIPLHVPKNQGCESEPGAVTVAAAKPDECSAVLVDDAEYSSLPAVQDVKHNMKLVIIGQAAEGNKHIAVSVGDVDCHSREPAGETQVCVS